MKKRFLSGLLAAVMTLGLALSAFPAIIANAATAEPIGSINLADKLEEGIAAYLNGETEKTWDSWQNVTKLNFGSFNLLVESQGYQNITRAWADGTTAGIEGKMGWATDNYVEGGSGMAVISSTGSAIRFEAAYTQTQKATYIVERDGVYKVAADVNNVDYSEENPNQETVKLEVLVNGELKDEITLAYGETGAIETEVMTLKVGDTVTLQTKSIRDNDEIHWKYKLDVAAELQVIEDLGPDASWNMHDELKAGLAAAIESGVDYKGTAFSAIDLGAFDFKQDYYSRAWEVIATGFKGASKDGSNNKDDSHDLLTVANGLVKTHADYNNTSYVTFTAPSYGKYKLIPTADLAVSGTGTSFVVTAGGTDLAIGPNGETTLAASSALSTVEVTLNEGDTIVVKTRGASYNTYFSFNFIVEYEAVDPPVVYDMATAFYNQMATGTATEGTVYTAGNFKFNMHSSWCDVTYAVPAVDGTGYKMTITDVATSAAGNIKATETSLHINRPNVNYTMANVTFTAPKDGVYTFVPKAVSGSNWEFTTDTYNSVKIQLVLNGTVTKEVSLDKATTTVAVSEFDLIKSVTLKAGDTIQVKSGGEYGGNRNFTFNFAVELEEDLSAPVAVESWNLYDEFSTNLAALAADGTDYVGTQISALNLGAFKLAPGYYTLVKNLSATEIGGKTTGGTNCHNVLNFSGDNVGIHTCYTNPVSITFTAPKAGAYVIDLSDELTIGGTTLAQTAFEVLVNGESVAKYTAAGAMSDIEVDLDKNDTVVLKVTTGVNTSTWAQTRAIFDCTINLIEETPVFASANIALSDDITIKFAVNKSWFTDKGYSNPMVRYELEDRVVEVTEYEEATINGTLRYRFALTGVGPQTMADTVKATLIATNAEGKRFAYETREYSVKTYCMNQITSTKTSVTQEFKAFCVNTLNYGAASQIYTGHNTDNLANADLTAEQAAWAVSERAEYKDTIETGARDGIVVWKSANMLFGSSVSMQFKFQTAADMTGCYVEVNGARIADENVTYNAGDDRYVIKYTDLRPDQFSKRINVVVKDANGTEISPVLGYDMETYVARVKGEDMKELGKKVIAYGDAAEIYAKSKN